MTEALWPWAYGFFNRRIIVNAVTCERVMNIQELDYTTTGLTLQNIDIVQLEPLQTGFDGIKYVLIQKLTAGSDLAWD